MTNGQKIRQLIEKYLTRSKLTLNERADFETAGHGEYEPTNLKSSIIEVQKMIKDKDRKGLISLLKKLPIPLPTNSIIHNDKAITNREFIQLRQSGIAKEEFTLPSTISKAELTLFKIQDRTVAIKPKAICTQMEDAIQTKAVTYDHNKVDDTEIEGVTHINGVLIDDIAHGRRSI